MTGAVRLKLDPRETLGKKVSRLRRNGIIPVQMYGPGQEPRSLQCDMGPLVRALARAGANTPIIITIQGERGEHLAFAREIQWNPRRDDLLHVDFLVAQATRPVSAQVPIVLTGESPGARMAGGAIMQQLHNLDIEAFPLEMPHQVEVDLADLTEPDQVMRASDVKLSPNLTMLTAPDEVVVRIEMPRAAVEEVEGEAVVEGAEAEEPSDTGSKGSRV